MDLRGQTFDPVRTNAESAFERYVSFVVTLNRARVKILCLTVSLYVRFPRVPSERIAREAASLYHELSGEIKVARERSRSITRLR